MQKGGKNLIAALCALALVFSLGFYVGRNDAPDAVTVHVQRTSAQQPAASAQQGAVEREESPEQTAPEEAEITPSFDAPIDLNTATKEQLMTLPGVGEVLAERILDYRQQVGRFVSTEQLMGVSGIGERKYEDLAAFVTVGE